MIAAIIRWSASNVLVVVIFAVGAALLGGYALTRVPLDALPLNESGKVARDRLPDPETARLMPSGAEYVAPAGAAQEALLALTSQPKMEG